MKKFPEGENRLRKLYHKSAVTVAKNAVKQLGLRPSGDFYVLRTIHDGEPIRIRFYWEEVLGKKYVKAYKDRQEMIDNKNNEVSEKNTKQKREYIKDKTGEDLSVPVFDKEDIDPAFTSEGPNIIQPTGAEIYKGGDNLISLQPTPNPNAKIILPNSEPKNPKTDIFLNSKIW